MAPRPRPFTLATRDGLDLVVESWPPAAPEPRPGARRVLVVHGYGEHHGRYGNLAEALTAAGHEVHLFDLRGHGESEGRRGHVDDFAEYRRDVVRVADRVAPQADGPLDLMAHSLGGLIALDTAIHHPQRFASLTLSDPFLAPTTPLPVYARRLARFAARFFPDKTFSSRIDPDGLSRDPEVVRAYLADPMRVERVTGNWLLEVLAAQERVAERAGEVRTPTLLLLGGDDPIASVERSKEVYGRLGSDEKRLVVFDGFRHEILNEIGRERVEEEIVAWLAAQGSAEA
jgi:alpha-beta hydrolase superfamily lysophospholipase